MEIAEGAILLNLLCLYDGDIGGKRRKMVVQDERRGIRVEVKYSVPLISNSWSSSSRKSSRQISSSVHFCYFTLRRLVIAPGRTAISGP